MFLNDHFLFRIFTLLVTTQASEALNYCYNATFEGFRTNTNVIKSKTVSHWINCVKDCAREPCCRSVNFKMKLTSENEKNCEMLHHRFYNEEVLEKNSSYDYIYLTEPPKDCNENCSRKDVKNSVNDQICDLRLNGSGYYFSANGSDWFHARRDCLSRGGDLAVPNTLDENEKILEMMKNRSIEFAWIGVQRREGKFYTVHDCEMLYHNWNTGEPNNANSNEDCAEITNTLPHHAAPGKWNDFSCSESRSHYICEFNVEICKH